MAGHSKWANIKHRKAAQDKKRAKIWTRIIKEITIAARDGGPDLDSNPSLRLAVQNGKGANLPKDTIERAIKKGSGAEAANLQSYTYEGYGPHGIAIYLHATSDNINRTVANVRSIFTKNNGSLGTNGSLSYVFETKGVFTIPNESISDWDNDELELELKELQLRLIDVKDVVNERSNVRLTIKNNIKQNNIKEDNTNLKNLTSNNTKQLNISEEQAELIKRERGHK